MTKKLISLVVGIILVATLAGCGSTSAVNKPAANETTPGPKIQSTSQSDEMTPAALEATPVSKIVNITQSDVVTSVAGGTGSGSDALMTPHPGGIVPNPAEVVTLASSGVSMRVLWTVSGYVLSKGFSGDEQAAKAYLFKPLDITDTEITFNGQACQGVTFDEKTVDAADYLSSAWKVTPPELGIDVQEIQVIKTNCSLPGFQEYIRLTDRRLVVPIIRGVFFFFEPAVAR